MGIEIIDGFRLNAAKPLDDRTRVADDTARLAIKWVVRGLKVFQDADSGDGVDQTYEYIGDETTNLIGDWALFTSVGATGPTGGDGADGVDGDKYAGASTSSITVPTAHPTTVNLTTALNLAWTPGQTILVANTSLIYFTGVVTSYDSGTGALVLESDSNVGTGGPFTSWTVNLSGTPGIAGDALIHTESDLNPFDEAKITSVEADTWTTIAPYSASVLNDNRANFTVPAPLNGSMTDHSISYDGNVWYDNGIWRGPQGAKGNTGSVGSAGAKGSTGSAGVKGTTGNTGSQGGVGPQGATGSDATASIYEDIYNGVSATLSIKSGNTVIHNVLVSNAGNNVTITIPRANLVVPGYAINIHGILTVSADITIRVQDSVASLYGSFFTPAGSSAANNSEFTVKQYTAYRVDAGNTVVAFAFRFTNSAGNHWNVTGGNASSKAIQPAFVGSVSSTGVISFLYKDTNGWSASRPSTGQFLIRRLNSNLPTNAVVAATPFNIGTPTVCEWNWATSRMHVKRSTDGAYVNVSFYVTVYL